MDAEKQNESDLSGVSPPGEADDLGQAVEEGGFRLRVSKDRMYVRLYCDTRVHDLNQLAESVVNRLAQIGVTRLPLIAVLAETISGLAAESPVIEDAIVLRGVEPSPPVDGRIEWARDFFNRGFEVDEATGRVNFRRRLGNCSVVQGQLLATVVDPVKGRNGIDLMGNLVRVPQPRRPRIRAGSNVEMGEDGHQFFSLTNGRVRWVHDTLAVDTVFEIEGDVGLETGDISHDGAVVVRGEIQRGSRVHALGDIEVMGTVEDAHIQSGGTLRVHGGINGSADTRIVVAGGVHARFLLDANIQAGGDIIVENEIVHCTISARGAVLVPAGRLVGGEVGALGGVDVGQAGSSALVPTVIVAGEDHTLEGRMHIIKNKLRLAQGNVDKIHNTVAPLRGKIAQLPEKSRDAIRRLLENLPAMEAAVEELKQELEEVQEESESRCRPIILIRSRLFPEVRLQISGETLHVRDEHPGPIRPIAVRGRLRLMATRMRQLTETSADEGAAVVFKDAGEEG